MVGFDEAAPPASEQAIREVERKLGVRLPEDYRLFLRRHNGGYLEPNSYPRGQTGASVRQFYSAGQTPVQQLDELAEMAALYSPEGDADDHLRPGYLPIGEDDGGNLICLVVDEDDPGAVYFWEHETTPADEAYTRLADSFDELFGGLESRADAYLEPPP